MLRRIIKIAFFGLIGLALWMLTVDGPVLNRFAYSQHPEQIRRFSTNSQTAIVFFTGAQSSGIAHSAPLRDLWSRHGDVIVVEYNRRRFDARATVHDTHQLLTDGGYRRVIIIGASMGGLLATDLIDLDRVKGRELAFAVLLQDTPQDIEDLYHKNRTEIFNVWRPGPVNNLFMTDPFWHYGFNPPPPYMLGSGVDKAQLRAQYSASSSYPLSGWAGQVNYVRSHRGFDRNQYLGVPLVVMQSQNDNVVKPNAHKWQYVFGGGTVVNVPQTTHIGFVEYPDRWRAAFQDGFAALPEGW